MGAALLACRAGLALVFMVAGVGKLFDLEGSRRAVAGFGVPARLAALVGTALPLLEMAVAVALIPVASARYGAIGAAALLGTFSIAIGNAIARGRAPDCHCFGQVHSAPAGIGALVRNTVLLAPALFVVSAGWGNAGLSATHWLTRADAAWVVAIVAGLLITGLVCFQVWFSLQLLSQNGRTLARLEALESRLEGVAGAVGLSDDGALASGGLGEGLTGRGLTVGSIAPGFSLSAPSGEHHSLQSLLSGERLLMLLFSDAGCGPCEALLPDVARWQREHSERLQIVVIAGGDQDRNREKATEYGIEPVLLQSDHEVADLYEAHGTPMAVVIDSEGLIASPTVGGSEAIQTLVDQAVHFSAMRQRDGAPAPEVSRVGEPAPELVLADLQGGRVALRDLIGKRTVAIFWNPGCGFCQQMLPDLRRLESSPPADSPQLVVISAGDVESVRDQKIGSRVLLDPQGEAMQAFGAGGTPMAVLIENRHIASEVAAGAVEVLKLAGSSAPLQVVHAGNGGGVQR